MLRDYIPVYPHTHTPRLSSHNALILDKFIHPKVWLLVRVPQGPTAQPKLRLTSEFSLKKSWDLLEGTLSLWQLPSAQGETYLSCSPLYL